MTAAMETVHMAKTQLRKNPIRTLGNLLLLLASIQLIKNRNDVQ